MSRIITRVPLLVAIPFTLAGESIAGFIAVFLFYYLLIIGLVNPASPEKNKPMLLGLLLNYWGSYPAFTRAR